MILIQFDLISDLEIFKPPVFFFFQKYKFLMIKVKDHFKAQFTTSGLVKNINF